jgi:hypothetical protein
VRAGPSLLGAAAAAAASLQQRVPQLPVVLLDTTAHLCLACMRDRSIAIGKGACCWFPSVDRLYLALRCCWEHDFHRDRDAWHDPQIQQPLWCTLQLCSYSRAATGCAGPGGTCGSCLVLSISDHMDPLQHTHLEIHIVQSACNHFHPTALSTRQRLIGLTPDWSITKQSTLFMPVA